MKSKKKSTYPLYVRILALALTVLVSSAILVNVVIAIMNLFA